ncbi:MAG: helix-turn-helix domain-containing protein [Candidatus Gracilibacteria bacterium]
MEVKEYIQKALMELGLSVGEAKVYFEILNGKEVEVSYLKKITKYSVAGIYKILNSLVAKNFIYPLKKMGVRVFVAVPLSEISKKIALRGRKLSRIADKFNELNRLARGTFETQVYEGDSLTDYYLDIPYKIDDTIWCVGSFGACVGFMGPEVERTFISTRVKKGHNATAIIFDETDQSRDLFGRDKLEKRETKFIHNGEYPMEFSCLYGDNYLNFYKDVDGKVKILRSKSPDLAKAKLIQYQMMWNSTVQ